MECGEDDINGERLTVKVVIKRVYPVIEVGSQPETSTRSVDCGTMGASARPIRNRLRGKPVRAWLFETQTPLQQSSDIPTTDGSNDGSAPPQHADSESG